MSIHGGSDLLSSLVSHGLDHVTEKILLTLSLEDLRKCCQVDRGWKQFIETHVVKKLDKERRYVKDAYYLQARNICGN